MKVVKFSCIFLLSMICHAVLAQTQNISVVDDNGSTIVLEQPARRIISLAPHITELLFAVGAGDRLVGAMEFSDYPEPAKQIERVGNHNSIDLERISVLQPDLIFAWKSGNPSAAINKLQQLGFTIFQSEPKSLMDIVSSMQRFSQLTATQRKANKAIEKFQLEYQRLQQRYDNKKQVTVFYEIWNKPMMTVNGQHLISEVIEFCGGKNVFAELKSLAPTVAIEPVLLANPQVIIASSNDGKAPPWLNDWNRWPNLAAVKFGNLFFANWNHINRHSPRILHGIEEVCIALETARKNITDATGD